MYLNNNSIFNLHKQNCKAFMKPSDFKEIGMHSLKELLKMSCHYAHYCYITHNLYFTHITINDLTHLKVEDCLDYFKNSSAPLVVVTYKNITEVPYNIIKNIKKEGKLYRKEVILVNTLELFSCENFTHRKGVCTSFYATKTKFSCFKLREINKRYNII